MLENFEIKIIRMKTGEDVIGFIFEDYKNNRIHIKFPKTFYFSYDVDTDEETLVLADWITRKAFAYQEVSFPSSEILFSTYSNISFGYDYLDLLMETLDPGSELAAKIQQTITDLKQNLDEEEELENLSNVTLH